MNKRILVTGSNGQLGRELQRVALGSDNAYVFTDVEQLDITDFSAVSKFIEYNKIDVIVNCAAYTNVDKAESEPQKADMLNHLSVANLAREASKRDIVLIHISTDYVFDGRSNRPYNELSDVNPQSEYGRTKLLAEKSVVEPGCRSIIIRTSWLYSKWGGNFVKTMQRLTSERDTLSVIFDQVGTPTYAGDLADTIGEIIESNQLDKIGIYHYSNEGVCSWYDFAQHISNMSCNQCNIKPIHSDEFPAKVTRPHYSVLDKTKFKATFGIEIPYWTLSLKKCIKELE